MSDAADKQTPVYQIESVGRQYPDGNVTALNDVSLTINQGEYVAIMGPSGSGKSTLLNIMGTLDRPTSGEVYFQGKPLSKMKETDRLRAEQIGFICQSFLLLPTLSAVQNVQVPMFEGTLPASERQKKAVELLDLVNMQHRANHRPNHLSVGERQRVAIARALANDPVLVLADEPTGNLDSNTGEAILNLFDRLHQERGLTLVVVTHSNEVAERAERVIRISDGHLVEDRRVHRDPVSVET